MMRFSNRTNWELAPNAISKILAGIKENGQKIFDLTESNPTRCGFVYPPQMLSALVDSKNLGYHPSPQGTQDARLAVCDYYAQRKIKVDPQDVFLTSSTSEAYSFLFRLLADPGDTVLFPQPSYPLFQFLVDLNDLNMENYRLVYAQDRWRVDEESLSARITDSVKAAVFVNPNNPTGSALTDGEQKAVRDICLKHKIPIISDEVFLDYPFAAGDSLQSFLPSPKNLVFVLGGISKALALPQMKVSWIVLNGPYKDVQVARERLEVIADTYLSVNTPSQNALPAWLKHQPDFLQQVLARVRGNREQISKFIATAPGCRCLEADGGWYAVLRLPKRLPEEKFVTRLLSEKQVFVHPGYFFDFDTEPFVVVSLLVEPGIFQEGMARLASQIRGGA